ncbi:MAG TPA: hypothetical protein VLT45_15470 [Kofleriaceae bacterium]|nr:hypothetical protein [Kofleriaceae bacterium]
MTRRLFLVSVFVLAVAACGKKGGGSAALSKYPGTEDGAKQMLTDLRTSSDAAGMTKALEPTSADYKAVFTDDFAAKAEKGYKELWNDPKSVIGADPANTELKLFKATTDDIKAWTHDVEMDFPGGYQKVKEDFKPGLTVYRWKYTKPGETLGMAYDGLIYVNGHWAWFPKPWRIADH